MNTQFEKNAGPQSGQTSCGILSCALICATVAFVAWLALSPGSAQRPRLWVPVLIQTNGSQSIIAETRQLEFWTPSVDTKDYLHREKGEVSELEKWQIISNDDVLAQFGSVLHSNQNVFGYRRLAVWGQGRTAFKPGWWWTMNVTTNYSAGDLARVYQTFWKSPQAVFIEVVDNRGTTDN